MSLSHIIILAVVLIIAVPPEKLPELMRNLGRLINDLRRNTSGVWDEIKKDAAVKPIDFYNTTNTPPAAPLVENNPTENPEKKEDSKNDSNT